MALQSPFFGKRDIEPTGLRAGNGNTPTRAPGTGAAAVHPLYSAAPVPAPPVAAADTPVPTASAGTETAGGSKLTVGPNIKLKGVEITDCDTLVVEGMVEATMDSRVMQIAECGAFKGSAEIDIAEIRGAFDGTLTVRNKLVVYATGKVTGKIRYGKLVVEEGGQLSGEIQFGAGPAAKPALVAKQGLQAV